MSRTQLQVIGAGFGRTGTESLQAALNHLGYKCDHMKEIVRGGRQSDLDLFYQAFKGDLPIKTLGEKVFDQKGITATVDFPASIIWQELAAAYPDAKVIYTERESPEKWWDSASNTIFKSSMTRQFVMTIIPLFRSLHRMMGEGFARLFHFDSPRWVNPATDKEAALQAYNANAKAARAFDSDRILIFDVRQGWEPLCKFLDKEAPDIEFPRLNARSTVGPANQH